MALIPQRYQMTLLKHRASACAWNCAHEGGTLNSHRKAGTKEAPPDEDICAAVCRLASIPEDAVEVLCTYDNNRSALALLHPVLSGHEGVPRSGKAIAEELVKALAAAVGVGFIHGVRVMGPVPEVAATVFTRALEVSWNIIDVLSASSPGVNLEILMQCGSLLLCPQSRWL